ncbi:MAG TPA: universal stress protein, partial [Flavisolibacter sp.]|nr:universal stress protein [Flavisolibacter sp.]
MNPFSIQRILVPTDLSHTSLNALSTAVALARKHYATLFLLNVCEPDFTHHEGDEDGGMGASNSSDVLAALEGTIQYANGMRPQILRVRGNVTETIIKSAFEHHIDLIVMGAHGASGYRDGFMGSNTYEVIKYSSCPVLSIPATGKFDSFRKALYPVRPVQGALMRYEIASHFLSR